MAERPTYDELAARLALADQTLDAIRGGSVDALVVAGEDGPQVYSLDGANAFYRVLVEQMPVGAAAVQRDGAILYANGTFARMLDLPLEAVIGADVQSFARGGQRDVLLGLLDGTVESADVVLRGGGRDIETGLSARRVERGGIDVVCLVAADLTARRVVEDELREARARAEQASRAKNAFLSQMSHELRTPLNVILGFCQLLETEELTPDQRDSVASINSSGELLLELIIDVLEFSRIESGEARVDAEALSVSELIEEAAKAIRPLADERAIRVTVAAPVGTGAPYVRADRRRLRQILLNLLSNAVKFNHSGGSVQIDCVTTADQHCRVVVTDTGPGIPAAERARLFTPFERLGAERRNIQGTGLGLAVSRSLAETMGGRLSLDEAAEETTFALELPLAAPPRGVVTTDAPGAARALAPDPAPRGSILYVEDNPSNVLVMRAILRRRPNVTLITAETAADGFARAVEHVPDLILLDRQLPDESGDVLLPRLRRDPRTAGVPVIIATADANAGDAARLIAAGASDYATKPLDLRWLLGVIDRACGPTDA